MLELYFQNSLLNMLISSQIFAFEQIQRNKYIAEILTWLKFIDFVVNYVVLYTKGDVWRVRSMQTMTKESQNWCRCIDHSRGVDITQKNNAKLTLRARMKTFWPNAFETIILTHGGC
jgi:hypothetical protein